MSICPPISFSYISKMSTGSKYLDLGHIFISYFFIKTYIYSYEMKGIYIYFKKEIEHNVSLARSVWSDASLHTQRRRGHRQDTQSAADRILAERPLVARVSSIDLVHSRKRAMCWYVVIQWIRESYSSRRYQIHSTSTPRYKIREVYMRLCLLAHLLRKPGIADHVTTLSNFAVSCRTFRGRISN